MDKFYVYLHRKATDNKVFYIGKGHGRRANSRAGRSTWWTKTADKHGFTTEIIFDNLDEETAFQVEKDTILEHRYFGSPLVNVSNGGEGSSGYKFTDEQRQNLSQLKTGRKLSPAHIEAVASANRGKVRDRKIVDKIASTKRCKTVYKFVFNNTNKIFSGTRTEFQQYSGINRNAVSNLFKSNPRKSVFGWSLVLEI